jgi:hypothetical protein
LSDAISRYLLGVPKRIATHQYLFNNLTPIWNQLLANDQHSLAQHLWQTILRHAKQWERARNSRIHKGSIFYYWGGTAVMAGDLDKGFFLMHSAYEEDRLTYEQDRPSTPAAKFVALDFESGDQLFRPHALMLGDYLDDLLKSYRLEALSHLKKEQIRVAFLEGVVDLSITFAFTHALSRLHALRSFSYYVQPSDFSHNYLLNLLFDMVIVIDAALKEKVPHLDNYSELMGHLSQSANLPLSISELQQEINPEAKSDFGNTIFDLLDRVFRLSSGRKMSRIECDLAISYCIRNRAAHNIASAPIITPRFEHVLQSVMNVLFLSIDTYYT